MSEQMPPGDRHRRPEGLFAMLRAYFRVMDARDALLRPLTRLWAALGLTPNTLSYAGVATMGAFAFLARTDPFRGLLLLAIGFGLDLSDGALARHLRRDGDRGKFTDMVCDSLVFTLFTVGLVHGGLLVPVAGLAIAYLMLLSKVLRSVRNALFLDTDWHFKAVAGFVPNSVVGLFYLLYVLYVATGVNPFRVAALPAIGLLALDAGYFYVRILGSGGLPRGPEGADPTR